MHPGAAETPQIPLLYSGNSQELFLEPNTSVPGPGQGAGLRRGGSGSLGTQSFGGTGRKTPHPQGATVQPDRGSGRGQASGRLQTQSRVLRRNWSEGPMGPETSQDPTSSFLQSLSWPDSDLCELSRCWRCRSPQAEFFISSLGLSTSPFLCHGSISPSSPESLSHFLISPPTHWSSQPPVFSVIALIHPFINLRHLLGPTVAKVDLDTMGKMEKMDKQWEKWINDGGKIVTKITNKTK